MKAVGRVSSAWVRRVRWTVGTVALVGLMGQVATVGATETGAAIAGRTHGTLYGVQSPDLTGKWRMSLDMEMGHATPLLELRQNEGKLSGTYTGRYGSSPVSGDIDGRTFKFGVAMETMTLQFRGEVQDDGTLKGTADFGEMGAAKWTAAREN